MRVSDLQSDSDLDSIRNSGDVFLATLIITWSCQVYTLQEEQERQARQIKELETERLRQESLLQEKGAQIKVEVHFFLFCEIFSLVQKVLEDENVALVALLGNLKTQLSQVARYLQINTDISPIGPESDPSMALSQTELTYAFLDYIDVTLADNRHDIC